MILSWIWLLMTWRFTTGMMFVSHHSYFYQQYDWMLLVIDLRSQSGGGEWKCSVFSYPVCDTYTQTLIPVRPWL